MTALQEAQANGGEPEPAAAQLLHDLSTPGQEAEHRARAEGFVQACRERDRAELTRDLLRVISLRRDRARQRQVSEFRATMPVDDLEVDPDTHFDSATCTLLPAPG